MYKKEFTNEDRIKAIELHIHDGVGYGGISDRYGFPITPLRHWTRKYQTFGAEGLIQRKGNQLIIPAACKRYRIHFRDCAIWVQHDFSFIDLLPNLIAFLLKYSCCSWPHYSNTISFWYVILTKTAKDGDGIAYNGRYSIAISILPLKKYFEANAGRNKYVPIRTFSKVRFPVQESRFLNAFVDRILSRKVLKKDAV